jgi:superfamily II DNA helicase RecQ
VAAPLVERRRIEARNDAFLRRLEKLKVWRKKVGLEMGVESDVILPKPYLSAIAENPPKDIDELMFIMKETPSRVEKYGAQILKVLGAKNAN